MFKKFFSEKKYLKILVIVLTTLVAYGQTLRMYFWQDDFALIFKLQHPIEPAGSFGPGIIGNGAYKYLVTPYVPFFPIFGTNAFWYFLVGLLSYLVVIYYFYLLAKKILDNKNKNTDAFVATIIFASGYIGSDIMFRIINSWQTNIGLVLALIAFNYFISSAKISTKVNTIKVYFASLVFYFLATEFVYVRSHSLIFVFLAIDIIYFLNELNFKKILNVIIRQIPFWSIFYLRYVRDVPSGQGGLKGFFEAMLSGKFEYLAGLIGTIGNGLVPNFYQIKITTLFPSTYNLFLVIVFAVIALALSVLFKFKTWQKIIIFLGIPILYILNKVIFDKQVYWYNDLHSFVSVNIGLFVSWIIVFVSIALWNKKSDFPKLILLGYTILASQIFGYFIQYPETVFATTHRYLSYASIGYALLLAGLFGLIRQSNKKYYIVFVSLVVISNLILGFTYQARLVKERSMPTDKFYKDLLNFEPSAKKNAIFYFDLNNSSFIQSQFNDFFSVGSMPNSTALSIWYGIDRDDIRLVTTYDEFLFNLSQTRDIQNVYTFYYGNNGLINTTKEFRQALSKGGSNFSGQMSEVNILGKLNYGSGACTPENVDPILGHYFDYLSSRQNYYHQVKVNSLSEWSGEETQNVVDNNLLTDWRGHRIYWNENTNERLTIDLGRVTDIDKLAWVNTNKLLSPMSYEILTSRDGSKWQSMKKVTLKEALQTGQTTIDEFEPVMARFVRLNITSTLSNDSPAISEIEVVESRFDRDTVNNAISMTNEPMKYMDLCTFNNNFSKIKKYLNIKANIKTNKGINTVVLPLSMVSGSFKFVSVPGGTAIDSVSFDFGKLPLSYEQKKFSIRNLNFYDISKSDLIKSFSKN